MKITYKRNALRTSRRWFAGMLAGIACTFFVPAFAADAPKVLLKTSMGNITVELYPDQAPKSTANFLQYARDGHYNGTVFHRVIDNFMIQGGGFKPDMSEKPTREPVENEAKNGLKNKRYTVAMARTTMPHSATAQFFINDADNAFLDYPGQDGWGYTVFGKVVDGTEVVDRISQVKTSMGGMHQDVPVKAVIIESASVVK